MFDSPTHTQTSPTYTSLNTTLDSVPSTDSLYGPPVSGGANSADQRPSSSAVAGQLHSPRLMVSSSPGSAVPQMRTAASRCNTMLSEKILGSRISALTKQVPIKSKLRAQKARVFVSISGRGAKQWAPDFGRRPR